MDRLLRPHVTDKTSCPHRGCNKCDCYRKQLEEYKDAEEQGLLKMLPCCVGDTVYLINHTMVNTRRKPLKCNIDEFVIERSGCFAVLNGNASYYMLRRFKAVNINNFGSIVFLTEKEAEAALAKEGGV